MLFNSIEFAIFLPIVFLLYWFVFNRNLKLQNFFIVVVSYVFYGWWDWRFLFLIAFTSFCSWGSGLLIERYKSNPKKAKAISALNIVLNLLILGVFKYYDFFVKEFVKLFGLSSDGILLNIILPVGISFYTFQALSYSIDVYRGKLKPTHDIAQFFAFVSFFPQLVAGPIERATNLLPQFEKPRRFDYDTAVDGLRQILWGLFKKMVVADNCAVYVDQVFSNYQSQSGSTLLLAAVLFTFQIYGDFSGYSDIAIGTAKLFGIKLMRNFNVPYFSRDIAEFWRRWHISLTTHGANWTFIVWGAYHALLFLPLILLGKNRKHTDVVATGRFFPSLKEMGQMLLTFFLAVVGWIVFRANTIEEAWNFICRLLNKSLFSVPWLDSRHYYLPVIISIVLMLVVEWLQRNKEHAFDLSGIKSHVLKFGIYYVMVAALFWFGGRAESFIYFQF